MEILVDGNKQILGAHREHGVEPPGGRNEAPLPLLHFPLGGGEGGGGQGGQGEDVQDETSHAVWMLGWYWAS